MPTPRDKTLWRVLAFFLVVLAVFAAAAFISIRNINRSVAGSDWVNHTHAVIQETEGLRSDLYIGDGAAHTYVVTGDPRDRRASTEALSDISDHLDILTALTRNESGQKEEVAKIGVLVNNRLEFLRGILAAHQSGDTAALKAALLEDAGQPGVKQIERAVGKLKDEELGLLTDRDTASFLQAQTTRWTVMAGVVLDVLLLAGAGWLIWDDLGARKRAAKALQQANDVLEDRVRDRTAELASSNQSLKSENLERRWTNQGLEHQLRYNNLIISSINDLVLVLTKATNISRVNPAVTKLTGREPHELIQLPLASMVRLVHEGDGPMIDPVVQAMNEGRDIKEQPAIVTDKLGREIPVQLALFPLRDKDKIVGAVVIIQASEGRKP
ncbi:MAG TPA: CHASE3 domain-containing protein [Opitutaceae bacterium]|jgi:PAS domain S-box-containing protein|nr:CHASE3 domain-containing protein [Opitutaceae bacterium]